MTKVTATYMPDTKICELYVYGHATGSEKVCAAVSGLVYSLAGFLINDNGTRMLHQWLEPGDAKLQFICGERGMAAFQMACVGFLQFEKSEPDYIQTNISENIF